LFEGHALEEPFYHYWPSLGPLTSNPNISPILGATPSPRVHARRTQLCLSIPTSFAFYPLPFRGCGPQSWSKMGANCKFRPQRPRDRCIQFLLEKYEIGVIWSGMPGQSQLIALLNPKLVAMAKSLNKAGPHLTHDSLDPFESTAQTTNRSVQTCLHSSQQKVPILYNGTLSPKLPLLMRDGDTIFFTIP